MARLAGTWSRGLAALLLAWGAAQADPPVEADKYAEHLRFLGYAAEIDAATLRVTHQGSPVNFRMKSFKSGTLLVAGFGVQASALTSGPSADLLGFVNALNKEAWVSRFYYDDSDKTLTIESWFGGAYDRERFGQFFDNWKADTEDLLSRHAEQARQLLE
ncbi:MAG: YbjN domain-containing protein [Candidatus Latescibacterota bacterium]